MSNKNNNRKEPNLYTAMGMCKKLEKRVKELEEINMTKNKNFGDNPHQIKTNLIKKSIDKYLAEHHSEFITALLMSEYGWTYKKCLKVYEEYMEKYGYNIFSIEHMLETKENESIEELKKDTIIDVVVKDRFVDTTMLNSAVILNAFVDVYFKNGSFELNRKVIYNVVDNKEYHMIKDSYMTGALDSNIIAKVMRDGV